MDGLAWRKYRRRSARHRVELRIKDLGLDGFDAYLDLLRSDPGERSGLADMMRVTVSRFFREQEEWRTLSDNVLPALLAGKTAAEPCRAWSAGCCGGEEPYTLALILRDRFEAELQAGRFSIRGTDVDAVSVADGDFDFLHSLLRRVRIFLFIVTRFKICVNAISKVDVRSM